MLTRLRMHTSRLVPLHSLILALFVFAGCEPAEEKVLEIDTPGVDIDINRSPDGASVDVDSGQDQSDQN